MTNEILKINKKFNLLFVNWPNYNLIENDQLTTTDTHK